MKNLISYLILILFCLIVLCASIILATCFSEMAGRHYLLPQLLPNETPNDATFIGVIAFALYALSYGGFFFLFRIAPDILFSRTASYAELCSHGFTIQLVVGVVYFDGLFRSVTRPTNMPIALFGVAMLVLPWLIRQLLRFLPNK